MSKPDDTSEKPRRIDFEWLKRLAAHLGFKDGKPTWSTWSLVALGTIAVVGVLARETLKEAFFERVLRGSEAGFHPTERDPKHPEPSSIPKTTVLAVFPPTEQSGPILKGIGLGDRDSIPLANMSGSIRSIAEEATPRLTGRKLVNQWLKNDEVVLIIGHESSSTVRALIDDVYENPDVVGDTPMPLILPAATNPDLLQSAERHILRLPAPDTYQISLLQDFCQRPLQNSRKPKVTLVLDQKNDVYSSRIGEGLSSSGLNMDVISSVGVQLAGDGFSKQRFLAGDPDIIVFVGMEPPANIFVENVLVPEALRNRGKPLSVVFTDGVTAEGFYANVSRHLAALQRAGIPRVRCFLTGPFRMDRTSTPPGEVLRTLPTYEPQGAEAARIAAWLVNRAQASEGRVTRRGILTAMNELFKGVEVPGTGGAPSIRFTESGENANPEEHLFELLPANETRTARMSHASECSCGGS